MARWNQLGDAIPMDADGKITFTTNKFSPFGFRITGKYPTRFPIGGRIFYDAGDNGVTYTFYDANDQVVVYDGTIDSLANAVSYEMSDIPDTDRFYVFYNELVDSKTWGDTSTSFGSTGWNVGTGKTNTLVVLGSGQVDQYSIFASVQNCRATVLNGCNDWFIPSVREMDKLRESNLTDWFYSGFNTIWTSTEADGTASVAYAWQSNRRQTNSFTKSGYYRSFIARSF